MPTRETPTHSPAPWVLDVEDPQCAGGSVRDAAGERLLLLTGTSEADDRVILNAPDLLAAVRRWLRRCEEGKELFHASNYAELSALVDYIDGGGEWASQPWKAPPFEVFTNRHPATDGQAWGWIGKRGQLAPVAHWHGEQERIEAERRAATLNEEASEE